MKKLLLPLILLLATSCTAQTRQDTLRGSNGRGRDWWDVQKYDLRVDINREDSGISGKNTIQFVVKTLPCDSLQIDLQTPMLLDSIFIEAVNDHSAAEFTLHQNGLYRLNFRRDGNVYWVILPSAYTDILLNEEYNLVAFFHGKPRMAVNPPWDGGFVWTKDVEGNPWVAVACQGLGASSWWPCKDYQGDKPDDGINIDITLPDNIPRVVSNGNTLGAGLDDKGEHHAVHRWLIENPINLYNLTFYLGDYATFTDTFHGEKGVLPLTFHPLRYNEAKAREHFAVVKDMLRCFEHWMGPYPFYEDGYKLVEAPYLGMEHQSAIAYGNKYQMGYLGTDRSGTGVGMLFDYIIIHESGHEWFGNNITAKDVADNWIHEGFTTYTETLYAEWIAGKEKAARYNKGEWRNIDNDRPIIGAYGINDDGSGDKYDKGTAILHMLRTMLDNDSLFRQMLRGLNKEFWHQTVTTKQVEEYIDGYTSRDLRPFFNQYLRTTQIPKLEWYKKDKKLHYRFANVVDGFSLPVRLGDNARPVAISEQWQSTPHRGRVEWEDNFLMKVDEVSTR
jgi:hypothetical protein